MARVIMLLVSLVVLGLGVWTTYHWWDAVKPVLLALVALGLLLFGLTLLIFALSEIAGARTPKETSEE